MGLVWRETGAVRNARPSRGQAASTRRRRKCGKRRRSLPFELTDGCYGWEVSTQQALTVILNGVPVAFSTDRQSADLFYHHRPYCRMNSCTQMAHRVVPQCPLGPEHSLHFHFPQSRFRRINRRFRFWRNEARQKFCISASELDGES